MRFIGNAFCRLLGRREVNPLGSYAHIRDRVRHLGVSETWGEDDYCAGWTGTEGQHPCDCYDHGDSCERIQWEEQGCRGKEPIACSCLPAGEYKDAPLYCGDTMILMCDCCDVEFNNPIRCGWEERIAVGDPYWISEEIHSVNLLAGVGINQYGDWVFRDGLRSIVCDHCAQEADALIQDGYAV